MRPRRREFVRALLRGFSVQGSWNYRTMIGAGVTHALAPLLARIHAGDAAALGRALEVHAREFNAHPYLSPIAVGALARLEHDGADPDLLMRFRLALRGPLGALGDRVVWAAWRPFCTLAAAVAFLLGAAPLAAVAGFLVVYNVGHVWLRLWGLRSGWRAGREIGTVLKAAGLKRIADRLVLVNLFLAGLLAALLIGRAPGFEAGPAVAGLAVAAGLGGYFVGRVAGLAVAALFLACMVWPL